LTRTMRGLPIAWSRRAVQAAFSKVLRDSISSNTAVSGTPASRARSRITAASVAAPAPPPDMTRSGAAPSRKMPTPSATRRRSRSLGRPPPTSWQPSTTIASAASWFRAALASAGAERGEALLRIHDGRLRLRRGGQAEVEFGGVVRSRNAEPLGLGIGLLMLCEIADQGVLDREYRIALQILVGTVENMRRDRLVAVGRHDEMNMGGPPGMPPGRLQHAAHRPVRRDRVVDRQHRADQVATLGIAAEFAAHVQFVRLLVLCIVK